MSAVEVTTLVLEETSLPEPQVSEGAVVTQDPSSVRLFGSAFHGGLPLRTKHCS